MLQYSALLLNFLLYIEDNSAVDWHSSVDWHNSVDWRSSVDLHNSVDWHSSVDFWEAMVKSALGPLHTF